MIFLNYELIIFYYCIVTVCTGFLNGVMFAIHFPLACVEITSFKNWADKIPNTTVPVDKLCKALELPAETCEGVAKKGVAWIVGKYVEQNPKACWEVIVQTLCKEEVGEKKLAKKLADEFKVQDFAKHCE